MSSKKSLTTVLVMVLIIVMTLSGCDDLFGASDDDNGGNSAPVANAGPDQEVEQGVSVTLDGTESTDADGDALTYEWAFTVVPDGSTVESEDITDSDTASATFVPDVAGIYTVRLTISDGDRSDSDLVSVTTTGEELGVEITLARPDMVEVDLGTIDGVLAETVTVSAGVEEEGDVDAYEWRIDAVVKEEWTGLSSVLLDPADVLPGRHTLTVLVEKDGQLYSASIDFEVQN
jgi:hypothetical protein